MKAIIFLCLVGVATQQKMMDCVHEEKLSSYLGDCREQLMLRLQSGFWLNTDNFGDSNCKSFIFVAQCISLKVRQDCGEEASKPVVHGMMLGLKKRGSDAARSPKCVEAIEEAEEYFSNSQERKRRFVPDVSFAKLTP